MLRVTWKGTHFSKLYLIKPSLSYTYPLEYWFNSLYSLEESVTLRFVHNRVVLDTNKKNYSSIMIENNIVLRVCLMRYNPRHVVKCEYHVYLYLLFVCLFVFE